jgi:hypothetical protein
MSNAINLFTIGSRAQHLFGYRDIPMCWSVDRRPQQLFGDGGALGVPHQTVIADYDAGDDVAYAEAALEESFTEDEAAAFAEWLRTHRPILAHDLKVTPVKLPINNNSIGFGAMPVGGGVDHLVFGDDYDLPFRVLGYYDIRECLFDPTLPGAQRATHGTIVRNGQIEPWYVGEEGQ